MKPKNIPTQEHIWVFILAGQSNMAGRGLVEPQDTIPNERILTINKNNELVIAKEPLHWYEPTLTGLDCGLSFGKELATHIPDSISILIIPTAVGGSSISQWLGDSTHRNVRLFTNFLEKVEIAKRYGSIKGMLWHQGESDANPTDIPLYKDRVSRLFSQFRKAAGNNNLPIIVGELGAFSTEKENWNQINSQIALYAATDPLVSVVKTNDLKDKGDQIHFDPKGQRALGKRYATAYLKHFK